MPSSIRKMKQFPPDQKGELIRFIGGTYCGKDGWVWAGRNFCKKQVWVIIRTNCEEVGTRVDKKFVEIFVHPKNWVEAALQQHPEVELHLNELCEHLAKCNIDAIENAENLQLVVSQKLTHAIEKQRRKGNGATWLRVHYDEDDEAARKRNRLSGT